MNHPKSTMRRPSLVITLAILLFLSVNILADRYMRGIGFDLTQEGLYTLSDGSRKILSALPAGEPVKLKFYFSKSLMAPYASLLSYGKRVEDLLRTLENASNGAIVLDIIDPEPLSEQEDEAVSAGITGIPLNADEMLYFGVTAEDTADASAVIPNFNQAREKFLEYDLINLIITLDKSGAPNVKIITSLPLELGPGGDAAIMQGRKPQPYVVYSQMQEFFNIEMMASDFSWVSEDTDVLLLAHPPALSEQQLFAVEQYVLKGGKAIVMLDPYAESMASPQVSIHQGPKSSTLDPLLESWGVSVPEGQVIGDKTLAQRISMGGYGPDAVKDYLIWLAINKTFLNDDDVVTGTLASLNMASSGVIDTLEGGSTTVTPLVSSSANAMLYPVSAISGTPNPDRLNQDFEASGIPYTVAARITGPAKTAFPHLQEKMEGPLADTSATVEEGNINIVLVADTDLLENRFWVRVQDVMGQQMVQPVAGNGNFILSLVEQMAGSDALLTLRSRGTSQRVFTVVETIRREAESKYADEQAQLTARLSELEASMAELQAGGGASTQVMDKRVEEEVEHFRQEMLETRKALRDVRRNLRKDIEGLGSKLAVINIVAIPLLLIIFALLRLLWRKRRRAN